MLRVRDARRRVVVELRRLGAAQRGDDAGEDHGQAEAAGIDDARLAQDRQQLGTAPDRLLAGVERALEHLGDQLVLALDVVLLQPRLAACARARDATRCAISRTTVRIVPSAGSRTESYARSAARAIAAPIEHGVDQLAGARRQLLGGAADQLGEDHAGVAARAEQRGAGDRVDDLVAADLVELARRRRAGRARRARRAA